MNRYEGISHEQLLDELYASYARIAELKGTTVEQISHDIELKALAKYLKNPDHVNLPTYLKLAPKDIDENPSEEALDYFRELISTIDENNEKDNILNNFRFFYPNIYQIIKKELAETQLEIETITFDERSKVKAKIIGKSALEKEESEYKVLRLLGKDLFFQQIKGVENLDNEIQLRDIFTEALKRFNEIYHFANQSVSKMKSKEFSFIVKNSETLMLVAERISKIIVLDGSENQIAEVKNKFEELFHMIPLGPSVLLQRDIDNIKNLFKVPEGDRYLSKWGEFYHPIVSVCDLTYFFQKFCYKYNYLSVCMARQMDTYYDFCTKAMFTSIAFRKKKKKPSKFWDAVSYTFYKNKDDKKKQFDELKELVEKNYKEWGFKKFEIIHMEDMSHCKIEDIQSELDEWGWHVFLYHKNVNDDNNLAIPVDEEHIQDLDTDTRIVELQESNDNASSMTVDSVTLLDENNIQEKPLVKTKNKRSKSLKVTLQCFFKTMYLSIKSFIMRLFQWIKNRHQK